VNKVVIIIEAPLVRDFLEKKLKAFGLGVSVAKTGVDGQAKIRSEEPDLIVMDHHISRLGSVDILKSKTDNPNTRAVPVIMLIGKVGKDEVVELARYGVKKFFAKPIKMNELISAISEILETDLPLDTSPCIIDAHYNDGIIFVDVASGLNTEKIDLLKLKIGEILRLYDAGVPKVLVIMTNVQIDAQNNQKLGYLFTTIREATQTPVSGIKILTTSESVRRALSGFKELSGIEVCRDITEAMDRLTGLKVSTFIDEGKNVVTGDFLRAKQVQTDDAETIDLRFRGEGGEAEEPPEPASIAVVDDDPGIRELIRTTFKGTPHAVKTYDSGSAFTEELGRSRPDLVFLDLRMPGMDGFSVLQHMREQGLDIPVIVLSALTQAETVIKARSYGVKSYLSKPLKPADIRNKTEEALRLSI